MSRADALRLALLTGVLALAPACHLDDATPMGAEPSGSLRVVAVLPRSLALEPTATVKGAFTPAKAAAIPVTFEGTPEPGASWHRLVRGLPSGKGGALTVEAVDGSGVVLAKVLVPEVVLIDHRPALIVAVPHADAATASPASPAIDAVVSTRAAVPPEESMQLRVLARASEEAGTLTYAWSASDGTFSAATTANPEWKAPPRRGKVTLTVRVSDASGASATLDFAVNVEVGGGWGVEAPVTLNRAPLVPEVGTGPAEQARPGEPLAIQAVGRDEDADALTYAWSATCAGTFGDASAAQTSFTPTAIPPGTCDNCRLSVIVSDAFGGRSERSVGVCVRAALPPEITATSQSAPGAVAAELVKLSASAKDPFGEPLTFAWTTNTGLLGKATRDGDTSLVDWVALSCIPADTEPVVTVTVRNASGLSATHTFPVEWGDWLCGEHPPCAMTLEPERVTLTADCTTEQTVRIPDGFTFDGAGFTLTAVDPRGRRFTGAVLGNEGLTAHVTRVRVTARGLSELACDVGAARLRGILFEGATGSIHDSEVLDIHQKEGQGGCQEGTAIEVRAGADATLTPSVDILRNRVAGFQKAGIVATGRVLVDVSDNVVDGGGPVTTIARNGIQLSYGASGQVVRNTVRGNAYAGTGWTSAGLLVAGGPYYNGALCEDVLIQQNVLEDNDVGIDLSQADANGNPLPASTRLEVVGNTLSHAGPVTSSQSYLAAISDLGGANRISQNRVSGPGYSRDTRPGVTFDVAVAAGAAARLSILTPRHEAVAGGCSEAVAVQSQDGVGNLSALASPALQVSATGPAATGLVLYRDAACGDAVPTGGTGWSLTLEGPQHEAVFYFRATQPGALTLTVTGDGGMATSQEHGVH
ncbi:right-handed parallel beta-helix repeat-containing protein [Myxococcus sp. K15C18031901]|uniref:right-handed parallel beta-helix repeat-containing protein n=1 Tax=Myxococcus dinghuensis TaxID=2906761 RepID=UPI0020A8271B|nr:right-handed parallel beta-helix repeat-containing protein [Myxococcus dinghuensis]MCP3099295.1 right-handed parallel beta-helix repeat-containing protein [Myxococcus dinghuensis]